MFGSRYNFERLSNQLKRVLPWKNWNEPIPEAYFPKLDSLISSRAWPARVANLVPQNINREQDQIRVDLNQMRRWRDRFYEAVHSGYITDVSLHLFVPPSLRVVGFLV